MTNTKKKILIMCAVMIVISASFVFSTLAYFTDTSSFKYSLMASGTTKVELVDITYPYGSNIPVDPGAAIRILPGYEISKTVTARNTGTLPLYIRVKLESDIALADVARGREGEIDLSLVSYDINEEFWVYYEGYYYYRSALTGGTEATPLMTKVMFDKEMGNLYKDSTITFKLRMETVQANNNGAGAIDAIGWSELSPEEGGGT